MKRSQRQRSHQTLAELSASKRVRVPKYCEEKRQPDRTGTSKMKQRISSSCVVTRKKTKKRPTVEVQPSPLASSSNETTSDWQSAFETEEEYNEALEKAERALPKSPGKRKQVLAALFYEMDEQSQKEMIQSFELKIRQERVVSTLVEKVEQFYERDSISRLASQVDDLMTFTCRSASLIDLVRTRYLFHSLKKAYTLFIGDNAGEVFSLSIIRLTIEILSSMKRNINGTTIPDISMSFTEFCSLRPSHVLLYRKGVNVRRR